MLPVSPRCTSPVLPPPPPTDDDLEAILDEALADMDPAVAPEPVPVQAPVPDTGPADQERSVLIAVVEDGLRSYQSNYDEFRFKLVCQSEVSFSEGFLRVPRPVGMGDMLIDFRNLHPAILIQLGEATLASDENQIIALMGQLRSEGRIKDVPEAPKPEVSPQEIASNIRLLVKCGIPEEHHQALAKHPELMVEVTLGRFHFFNKHQDGLHALLNHLITGGLFDTSTPEGVFLVAERILKPELYASFIGSHATCILSLLKADQAQ